MAKKFSVEDHTGDEPRDLLYTDCLRCALETAAREVTENPTLTFQLQDWELNSGDSTDDVRDRDIRILVADPRKGFRVNLFGYLLDRPKPDTLEHEGCEHAASAVTTAPQEPRAPEQKNSGPFRKMIVW